MTTTSAPRPHGSSDLHVVVGKGPVGSTTAELLAAAGHRVRVLSRSGGPATANGANGAAGGGRVEHRAVDAADAAAVRAATEGADVIYNCLNPEYHRWATDWPPMATALLDAAEAHGAVLVTMSNLYGYGPVDGPMTEDLPLAAPGTKGRIRADMWEEALRRHRAGRVRITEARASDFWGPGVTDGGYLGERAVPRILAGKKVQVIGSPDHLHTWSYIPDVARTLVALGTDEQALGRAWHVPSPSPRTVRQMIGTLCDAAGIPDVGVSSLPWPVVVAAGVVVPFLKELRETRYQFDRPFVMDSSDAVGTFGIEPTPVDEAAAATVAWWRDRLAPAAAAA